jgi:hypothetical protein
VAVAVAVAGDRSPGITRTNSTTAHRGGWSVSGEPLPPPLAMGRLSNPTPTAPLLPTASPLPTAHCTPLAMIWRRLRRRRRQTPPHIHSPSGSGAIYRQAKALPHCAPLAAPALLLLVLVRVIGPNR